MQSRFDAKAHSGPGKKWKGLRKIFPSISCQSRRRFDTGRKPHQALVAHEISTTSADEKPDVAFEETPLGQQLRFVFTILIFQSLLTACVSVKLGPEVQKSKGISYSSPSSTFSEVSLAPADRAWKSNQTGNTISYFSECSSVYAPLEQMREDALGSLPKSQLLDSKTVQQDDREALLSLMEGKVEGIGVKMSQLVFQKNGCRYSLNYIGRQDQFAKELPNFDQFIKGFHAP